MREVKRPTVLVADNYEDTRSRLTPGLQRRL